MIRNIVMAAAGGAGVPPGPPTWDPAFLPANMTLSNANLTATAGAGGLYRVVRSTTAKNAGKVYFEVTISKMTNTLAVGSGNASVLTSTQLGIATTSFALYPGLSGPQATYLNSVVLNTGVSASSDGEVVSVAFDIDNKLVWISDANMRSAGKPWNNSATANPTTNTGGQALTALGAWPYYAMFMAVDTLGAATANFGASAFTLAVPFGFTSWDGTQVGVLPGSTWTARTLPTTASWFAVAGSGSNFVAVATTSTAAAYSTDGGATWAASTLPTSTSWTSVGGSGSNFVAVSGSTGTIAAYSTNGGATWTASTLPSSMQWRDVAGNGSNFVAVGATGTAGAYSTNGGASWTAMSMPSSQAWQSVAGSGSNFVAVVGFSANTVAAYSTNGGASWTASTLPTSVFWRQVAGSGSNFVATAGTGTAAAYSTDGGATWTASTLPVSQNWIGVTGSGSNFVAVSSNTGSAAAYSTDGGATWTASTLPSSSSWNSVAGITQNYVAVSGVSGTIAATSP